MPVADGHPPSGKTRRPRRAEGPSLPRGSRTPGLSPAAPPSASPFHVPPDVLKAAEARALTWDPNHGQALLAWYQAHRRDLPWRARWRAHGDPYHVWLSEIMLQQTTIPVVLGRYESFLSQFPTLAHLAAAQEEEVRLATRGLGYYRRFSLLHRAAQALTAGSIPTPHDSVSWRALPGVGDYTAAAIASITLGEAVPVVDGNVERVLCRLLDLRFPPNSPALKPMFRRAAARLLTPEAPGDFNQAMMELGQRVCTKSATPDCAHCPVAALCLARARGSQGLAPAPKPQAAKEDVALLMHVPRRAGAVGLVERGAQDRFLKGTWGFPYEAAPAELPADVAGAVGHGITRHALRIWVRPTAALPAAWRDAPVRWVPEADVDANLVANFDRKAWHLLRDESSRKRAKRAPRGLFDDDAVEA